MTECPACRPRPEAEEICEECRRVLARGFYMGLFHFMEAGFGVAGALAAVNSNWIALALFAFAAFLSIFLVVK